MVSFGASKRAAKGTVAGDYAWRLEWFIRKPFECDRDYCCYDKSSKFELGMTDNQVAQTLLVCPRGTDAIAP
jgi:hypothetical protein